MNFKESSLNDIAEFLAFKYDTETLTEFVKQVDNYHFDYKLTRNLYDYFNRIMQEYESEKIECEQVI